MMPKVDAQVPNDLRRVSQLLRRDGLEALERDAVSLGSPRYVAVLGHPCLHLDEIDSFSTVKNIKPSDVAALLKNGRLDKLEDEVQSAIEEIIGESFHKPDWAGENNDLFTTNVVIDGKRVATAFALNGRGKASGVLHLSRCGKNGDQIIRLFQSPAQLFVVQYVGVIGEDVVESVEDKAMLRLLQGRRVNYCLMNGQDTARLLRAYGKL
jgi:hypothetical protein